MQPAQKDFILLIPYYNHFKGLLASIQSIQYPAHLFEVLIVDDGSTEIIDEKKISEINLQLQFSILRLHQNAGILGALNTGLQHLKTRNDYKYIARLDCGDTCHPDRFKEQVEFFNQHPDIALLGTWCRFEDPLTKKGYDYISKTKHQDIVKEMHFKCSFIHPTVMFRKEVMANIGMYPEGYLHTEDYAYFWQILKHYKGEVLAKKLVTVEFSVEAISSKNYKEQLRSRKKVVKEYGSLALAKLFGLFILNIKTGLPTRVVQLAKFYK